MVEQGGFTTLRSIKNDSEPILSRVMGKVNLWIKNGKLFNFSILNLALIDGLLLGFTNTTQSFVLYWGFLIFGAASLVVIVSSMIGTVTNQSILRDLCKAKDQESQT